ncbi:hypothetical protein AB6A40_001357 [Gnathostoma spinigerum]|uniref:Uncharacterized protein n=1 Tax=Gnathostoma spinigerum TaxID=75299 RepID=A0ABD6E3Z4_9BILA
MPIPCMLSRLTTNPSYMNSHQAMSLPRSFQRSFHIPYSDRQRMTLTRSNSFQLFERKCRLGDARFQQALISFSTIQSPYAAVSLQSLLFDDGNSISHVSYRSPRDTLGNNTVPSSSMPNLSDSGIVYDENHAQNMLIPVANVAVSRHCHYCPS